MSEAILKGYNSLVKGDGNTDFTIVPPTPYLHSYTKIKRWWNNSYDKVTYTECALISYYDSYIVVSCDVNVLVKIIADNNNQLDFNVIFKNQGDGGIRRILVCPKTELYDIVNYDDYYYDYSDKKIKRVKHGNGGLDLFGSATLDLQFSANKSLIDVVSNKNLITFSRASTGTYVDSDGLIKTSPVNQWLHSEDLSSWNQVNCNVVSNNALAPDGTQTADKVTFSSTQVGWSIRYQGYFTGTYTWSGWIKTADNTTKDIYLSWSFEILQVHTFTVTGEWQRFEAVVTPSNDNIHLGNHNNLTPSSWNGGEFYIWGAQLEEGTTATDYIPTGATISGAPRFDHDPVTGESLGLLIEESRTNYYEASSDVTTPAGVLISGFTPTSDAVTSPDGTQEADRIVETTNASAHYVLGGQYISTTTDEVWTGSMFVKPIPGSASNRYPLLRISGGTGTFGSTGVIFDLVSKQTYYAAGSSYTDSGVIDYPDGWKKIYVTAPALSTGPATFGLAFYSNQNTTNFTSGFNYTGDGVSGFYIWGAQLEAGTFPTSYIPTSGSTVTRTPDIASIEGTNFSSWYNQSEGTVFADADTINSGYNKYLPGYDGNNNNYTIVGTGNAPNRFQLRFDDQSPFQLLIFGPNGTSAITSDETLTPTLDVKIAGTIKQDDATAYAKGVRIVNDTSIDLINPVAFYLGSKDGAGEYLNGHITRLAYFPTRKTDQELIKITDGTLAPAIITYGITSAGGVFNLRSTGTVDYAVDWDSTGGYEASTSNTLAHTYTAGNYDLVVYSDGVYAPYFNNVSADVTQITSVAIGSGADLGTDLVRAWYNASNMTTFACPFSVISSVTNFNQTWRDCSSLTSFPLLDASSGTNFNLTWLNCSSLTSFPLLNTSSVTNFGGAWQNCNSLTSFPLLNTSSGTNFGSTWQSCTSLTSFPLIDTSSGTNLSYAWYNCNSLTSFPLLDTSSGTNFTQTWYGCNSLTSFPLLNTSSGTNFAYAWHTCSSLTSFPLLNTSSGTSFVLTWYNCSSLTSFPLLDTSSGTEFYYTWRNCSSLTSFPLLDTSSGKIFGYAWSACTSLADFPANMFDTTGTLIATAFDNAWTRCALTAQSIENILVSLDTNGATGITLGIDGGTNANASTWSAAAIVAYHSLISKGWTITQNGTLAPAIITYGITSAGGTFNLRSSGTVDYAVDWDSTGGYEASTSNTLAHTYTAGNYSVVVYSDDVYTPYFNNVAADATQITSVAIGSGADLGTDLVRAWYNASNMTTFACPFDVTSSVTNFSITWSNCNSLTSFPLLNTSSGTNFSYAWRNCTSLTSFPLLDTSRGEDFYQAWRNCSSLTSFPLLDTSSGTNFSRAWQSCTNLTSFPLLNTSSGTKFDTTWRDCTSLTSFPLLDVSSGTGFTSAWRNCTSLTSFPLLDTSSVTSFTSAWRDCTSLADFPANMFDTTGTLVATAFTNAWLNCALTAQSIENILVSLDTNGATGITLNINGGTNAAKTTWSAAAVTAYDNLIVKGWTISFNA